jgi:hypothetical protein
MVLLALKYLPLVLKTGEEIQKMKRGNPVIRNRNGEGAGLMNYNTSLYKIACFQER